MSTEAMPFDMSPVFRTMGEAFSAMSESVSQMFKALGEVLAAVQNGMTALLAIEGFSVVAWCRMLGNVVNRDVNTTEVKYQDVDTRPLWVTVLTGILFAPVWVPAIVLSNLVLGSCYSIKRNIEWLWNASNKHTYDTSEINDKRSLASRLFFGVLTFPIWGTVSLLTNLVGGLGKSFVTMLHFANFTNKEHAVMWGEKARDLLKKDERHWFAQVFYGIFSAPLWLPIIGVTNVLSGVAQSWWKNVSSFWDIVNLGEYEGFVFENNSSAKRNSVAMQRPYSDGRNYGAIGFYSVLSAPLWLPLVLISNIVSGLISSSMCKCLQFFNITNVKKNTDGNGNSAEGYQWNDNRDRRKFFLTRLIFGVLSVPLWLPLVVLTNVVSGVFASLKYNWLSFKNITNTEKRGDALHWPRALGVRKGTFYNSDRRHWSSRLFYGMLTAPIWLPVVSISNLCVGLCQSMYFCLARGHNIVLGSLGGEYSVFGGRSQAIDPRHAVAQVFYSTLTFPIWAPLCMVTNIVDCLLSAIFKPKVRNPILYSLFILLSMPMLAVAFVLKSSVCAMGKALYRGVRNTLGSPDLVLQGHQNNVKTFFWGVTGVFSFGLIPLGRKLYRESHERSKRFDARSYALAGISVNAELQQRFKEALAVAKGNIAEKNEDGAITVKTFDLLAGPIRRIVRFCLGSAGRSSYEQGLKIVHNAYLEFCCEQGAQSAQKDYAAFKNQRGENSFFTRAEVAVKQLESETEKGDKLFTFIEKNLATTTA